MNKEEVFTQYQELKEKYQVNHLLNNNKKIIFILESPHVDELLNQAPVSGLSGKAMSKVLFGDKELEAIGIKLKSIPNSKIGIMNICSIPMQRIAYTHEKVIEMYGDFESEEYAPFFDILEKLRTNTKKEYKESIKNEFQRIILKDFSNELSEMKERELTIIPCGKTAETFFEASQIKNEKWNILSGVPHPSFGNWHKQKYMSVINEMKKLIGDLN